jgi:CRP-like cAMP-binding protein
MSGVGLTGPRLSPIKRSTFWESAQFHTPPLQIWARGELRDKLSSRPSARAVLSSEPLITNLLLSGAPAEERALIRPKLAFQALEFGQLLQQPGDPITAVDFINSGMVSEMAFLEDGRSLELGLVGMEGASNLSVLLGATNSHGQVMCQTAGTSWRIGPAALREVVEQTPVFRALLLRYVRAFHVQVAQTALCGVHHETTQRLARWLLATHDRSDGPKLALTQDLIALMLGVQRTTVSLTASMLQKAGLISYRHGRIVILDREGLENIACECHEIVASEYRQVFGDRYGE